MPRCLWCEGFDLYRHYHDHEWGVPLRDERALFELLILEGAQAGLSWSTILKKREHYRAVFDGFDPQRIAAYDEARVLPCSPAEWPCTASAWSGCAVEFGLPINSRNGSA